MRNSWVTLLVVLGADAHFSATISRYDCRRNNRLRISSSNRANMYRSLAILRGGNVEQHLASSTDQDSASDSGQTTTATMDSIDTSENNSDENINRPSTKIPIFQQTAQQWGKASRTMGAMGETLKTKMDDLGAQLQSINLNKNPKLHLDAVLTSTSDTVGHIKRESSLVLKRLAPTVVLLAGLFYDPQTTPITLPAILAVTLAFSATGFYLFLYFITVGYVLGVSMPVLAALVAHHTNPLSKDTISTLTSVHSGLVVAWGIRGALFFMHREFISWPELHDKVVAVNKNARFNAKLFCWVVFSLFYVSMITPCLCRLGSPQTSWSMFGKGAIGLQACGLLLESVADIQKSSFKSRLPENRYLWCHEGLWKYSTHPNYLGELMFWCGTFAGGLSCYHTITHWIGATVGFMFIIAVMRGAIQSLGAKHLRKYGTNVDFLEFRRTHSVLGPFHLTPHPKDRVSF